MKIIFSKLFRKKKDKDRDFFANANQKAHCNTNHQFDAFIFDDDFHHDEFFTAFCER